MSSRRSSSAQDVQIGQQVRAHRERLGLSQQALAKELNVSFQQLQKYEKGSNRISAGRLAEIARALAVPVVDLFAGIDHPSRGSASSGDDGALGEILKFQQTVEGRDLLRAFLRIKHRATRKRLLYLVRSLGDAEEFPDEG